MTTMYALPSLGASAGAWGNASGGWSNTSGGPDNGTYPQAFDDVIFDAKSGPSRNINISAGNVTVTVRSITMNSCAPMTIQIYSGSSLTIYGSGAGGPGSDLSKLTLLTGAGSFVCPQSRDRAGTATTLVPPQRIEAPMRVNANLTLAGPLVCINELKVNSSNDPDNNLMNSVVDSGGWPITAGFLTDTGGTYYMRGSSWTVLGSSQLAAGNTAFDPNYVSWQGGTLIIAAVANANAFNVVAKDSTMSVWVQKTPAGGIGISYSGAAINNFRVDGGCSVTTAGLQANTFTVSGTPTNRVTLKGPSGGSQASVALRSGAAQNRQYFDCADLSNFSFSPSTGIFYGRGCTTTNCAGFTNTNVKSNYSNFL